MRGTTVGAVLVFLTLSACHSRQPEGTTMSSFVDEYFDAYFDWSPSAATSIGFHQYDSKLEDLSQNAIERRIERLKQLQSGLTRARNGQLTTDEQIDAEIIESQIQAELLDLE